MKNKLTSAGEVRMKFKTLSVLAILCCPNISMAEDVSGRMYCEVKSNKVTRIIDGKPKEYTGFKGGITVGDTLVVIYRFLTASTEYITFKMIDEERDKQFAWNAFGANEDDIEIGIYSQGDEVTVSSSSTSFTLGEDEIWFSDGGSNAVNLGRYYKSDWQGIATFSQRLMHHTVTLDCRHTRDRIEEVMENMKSWVK